MNAQEANKLTTKSLKGPVIETYIEHIDMRIKKAAEQGESSIHNPQVGSADEGFNFHLSGSELKAVVDYYVLEGFGWANHPDPDPGHPCSGAYTTLRWK